MLITFPNGQAVDVIYDDAAHSYVVAHVLADGLLSDYRPTHGITASLDVVPKEFLKPWAAKEAANATLVYLSNNPETALRLPEFFEDLDAYELDLRQEDGKPVCSYYRLNKKWPWYKEAKAAYKRKSDESKEIGSWLHAAIEEFYKSDRKTKPILTPESTPIWRGFIEFDNFYKPKPDKDGLEFLVYSLMFGYSGQGDFRGVMSGKTCIGDWKTTNRTPGANPDGIDIEYFYQVGGLAQAEFERTGKWVDDLFIANFDKKGELPIVIWASEFGMSPQDAARCYVSCFNTHHMHETWEYKFKKRS
jgi:hypothetical protein